MSWFKVDDKFGLHPKALMAGNAALGGWVRAGSWCAQFNNDGQVPAAMLSVLGMRKRDADALVAAGLWREAPGGYLFHDWEEYQPTREKVEADREATRKRQQEWRDRHRDKQERNGVTNDVTNAVTNVAPTRPDPTRPVLPSEVPTPPTEESTPKPKAKRGTQLPKGWIPSEENREKIKRERPDLNLRVAHEDFRLYWEAEGKTKVDWDACWLRWMRNQKSGDSTGRLTTAPTHRSPTDDETCHRPGHSGWARNCAQCRADALAGTPDAEPVPADLPRRDLSQLGLAGKRVPA